MIQQIMRKLLLPYRLYTDYNSDDDIEYNADDNDYHDD